MGCRPPGSRCEARCAARRCVPSRVHARALYGSTCVSCFQSAALALFRSLADDMLRRGSLRRAAARANSRRNHLCGRGGNPPDSPYELGGNHGSKRKITAESGAQEHSPSFLHEPPQAPHARGRGRGTRTTGRRWTTFARFTFALLVGRWRAFPVVFRLVLGSGQGGEASVCGGAASLCSLTPCPGPLAPLPREIPSSEAPSHPSRICAQGGLLSRTKAWLVFLYDLG